MGLFLSLSGVIGKSKEDVISCLNDYLKPEGGGLQKTTPDKELYHYCIADSANGNTTIIYPGHFFKWDEASAYLSAKLRAPVFSFHIHDGDFWCYVLYVNGQPEDQFSPMPNYWDDNISEEEKQSWKGNAETIAKHVAGISPADIEKYLVTWPFDEDDNSKAYPDDEFGKEEWQLVDFMRKLKLAYPLEQYEKLQGDAYLLWTKENKPAPEKTGNSQPAAIAKKPWWKIW